MTHPIEFTLIGKSESGKTVIKHVSCNGVMLGVIKWFSNWRRYVFYPEQNTLFDAHCLSDINLHLKSMMRFHKEGIGV